MKLIKINIIKGFNKNSSINSCLGQNGINIFDFKEKLEKKIKNYKKGDKIRILIKVFKKNEYSLKVLGCSTSFLIKIICNEHFKDEKKINEHCIKKIIKLSNNVFNTLKYSKIKKIILGVSKSMSYRYVK
ncbi:hypothetical protein ACWNYQ_00015 [Candidatus Vidania fulgoroideorum]